MFSRGNFVVEQKFGTCSFKAYNIVNGRTDEVRRFIIDSDALTFLYMKEKLNMMFPSIRSTPFQIYWKDEEGDTVVISSDEELQIAMRGMIHTEIKKIYVSSDRFSQASPDFLHVGVTCDGCEGEVVGHRYKCISCPNYDLCSHCEASGKHPDHFMLRMPIPITVSDRFLGRKMGRWSRKMNKKYGGWFSYSQERQHGGRCGENKCSGHGHGTSGNEGNATGSGDQAPLTDSCPWANVGLIDQLGTLLNDFNLAPNEQSQSTSPQDLTKIVWSVARQVLSNLLDPLGASLNEASNAAASSSSTPNDQPGTQQQQNKEDNEKKMENGGDTQKNGEDMDTSEHVEKVKPRQDKPTVCWFPEFEEAKRREREQREAAEKQKEMEKEKQKQTVEQQAGAEKVSSDQQPSGGAGLYPNINPEPQPSTSKATPPDQTWTVIDAPEGEPNMPAAPKPNPSSFLDAFLPRFPPTDPKVDEALQKMLSMGFNNEGDWLRQLLASKNGDIEQVLDTLMPIRRFTPN